MRILNIKPSDETPLVKFDPEAGTLELSGRSLPEDAMSFYEPLITWLDNYSKEPADKTIFYFKLDYFNTASAKQLLKIFWHLEELFKTKKSVTINWYYHKNDHDMLASGERFAKLTTVHFNLIPYK